MRPAFVGMQSLWSFGIVAISILSAPIPTLLLREHDAVLTGKLEGNVRDVAGMRIPSAQVRIDNTAYGAIADERGYWFINNVPVGRVDLTATFVGFKRVQVKGLEVREGRTTVQDFALEAMPIDLEDIEKAVNEGFLIPRDEVVTGSTAIVTGIRGKVTTASGSPIAGALVDLSGSTTVTDSLGEFLISAAEGRKFKLKVSAAGYRILQLDVEKLKKGQLRGMTLRLQD